MKKAWWLAAGLLSGWAIQRGFFSYPPLPALPQPHPAMTGYEARERLTSLDNAEGVNLLPICRTQIWNQPSPAASCVVLLHGYTNCPHQFEQLGRELHADGHAVVAARLPYHGQSTRTPENLGKMSVPGLASFLGAVIDAAHGLGERVTLLGFSFGGVLAGWAAQYRADIDHAVLVSPSLGLRAVKPWLRPLYARALPILPDRFAWWDPVRRVEKLGPVHAYAGYSTRGVGVMLGLGGGLLHAARRAGPQVQRVSVVVNPEDDVIDNGTARALARAWQTHDERVRLLHFPAHLRLIHDLMDPMQPNQQVDRVYPFIRTTVLTPV